MGNLWFTTGPRFNALERAKAVTITGFAGGDPLFPIANLYDYRPGTIFRSNSLAGGTIVVDLQMFTNGDMEGGFVSGIPTGWSAGELGGTVADDTTHQDTGAHCVSITPNGTPTSILQANAFGWYRSNDSHQITVRAFQQNSAVANVFIRSLVTGNYWVGGAWQAARAAALTTSAGAYVTLTATFTLETFSPFEASVGPFGAVVQVELEATGSGAAVAYFDNVVGVPGINGASVHGHNVVPSGSIAATVETSPDNSAWTVQSANPIVPQFPSFYWLNTLGAIIYSRYWRLNLAGTAQSAVGNPYVGEFVLGQWIQALRNPNYPIKISWKEFQERPPGFTGAQWVYARAQSAIRIITWGVYSARGAWPSAQFKQFRDELFRRSRSGLYAAVVIPQDTDVELCVFGRLPDQSDFANTYLNVTDLASMSLIEDALPSVVS